MHKKITKAVVGSLMSAAMLASSVAAVAPMTVSAGNLLGQNDFDEGIGLPWHTCETQPAKQTFDIDDGVYKVHIVTDDGPESRWDLQFRHRGMHIVKGHEYKIAFDIKSSADGELATHIADLKGENPVWLSGCEGTKAWSYSGQTDDNGYEHTKNSSNLAIKKGENHFEGTFTAGNEIEVAEWAFHYGGAGEWQDNDCFPDGTDLEFDNMVLEDLTGSDYDFDVTNEFGVIRPRSNVRINQLGYYTNYEKLASYCTDNSSPVSYEVRDASGTAVFTGEAIRVVEDKDSGNGEEGDVKIGSKTYPRKKDSGKYVQVLDFSKVTTPGKYYIYVNDTVGVSGTQSGALKGAYDTKASGTDLVWTNPKSKKEWVMNKSAEFEIGDDIYGDQLLADSMNYYYQNRSGIKIESTYITSGDKTKLAHQAGHTTDDAYIQSEWIKFYDEEHPLDKKKTIDGVGGWYDAGDHGKYVVNGGISVWTLQNTYELAKKSYKSEAKFDDGKVIQIPENSNGYPDILDEARYELEWMMKMIVSSSDPYWGSSCEGMVYHKLHDHKWTGLATKSWDYVDEWETERIVKPPTYAATFNLAACAAQAARLWEGIDDTFAKKCLEVAKSTYDAAMKHASSWQIAAGDYKKDPQFAPLDQAIGGGPYGDTYVEDDAYWAACELFATTGDDAYYTDLKAYKNKNSDDDYAFHLTTNLGGGENKGSFSSFNWGCTSGLGTLSLYLNPDKVAEADYAEVKKSIQSAGDKYIERMNDDTNGMGIPYKGSVFTDPNNIGVDENGKEIEVEGYEWGSNSFVINNAMVLAYAYDATSQDKYLNGAIEAMDYIFGRNGLGFSYVSGYGNYTLQNPHHRYWCIGVDPEFPAAPDGVLSGGPGAGMQDPYVGGLGYKRGTVASQKCYVDSAEAWSVNEVTINWNAPLVAMASFMADAAGKQIKPGLTPGSPDPGTTGTTTGTTSGTTTATTTATTASTPTGDVKYGDANCDKEVNLADAVLVMQSISNPDKYGLNGSDAGHITAQGQKNADVYATGDGVTSSDALSIQKYMLKLIDKLPEA